ncbi:MAG: TIM barrel protein [Candidatus Diapherotrites archaeon]|nr:TIM barrel protein [Candidatus Diapherotrites archaeon]
MQPKKLLFGTAGIPLCTKPRDTLNGIREVKKLGLGSMELEFVHGVTIKKEDSAKEIAKTSKENEIFLSCHGPFFINLNAQDSQKKYTTYNYMKNSGIMAAKAGAYTICFHAAYLMSMPREKVTPIVKERLKEVVQLVKDSGQKIWIRPETAGRTAQWGQLDDIISVSAELDMVLPCVDFAHLYANSNGKNNSDEFFSDALYKIEKGLGKGALKNMHCHMEGIAFTEKGEKKHLPLAECKFNYKGVLRALKEFNCAGIVTCESPNIEEDALKLQKEFSKL